MPCEDLPFALFKQVVEAFPMAMRVCLAGVGEPLLNREVFEMVEYAKRKKMRTTLISNGTLLDAHLEAISEHPPDTLSISLNAPDPENFKLVCNSSESAFHRVVKGVGSLVETRNGERLEIGIGLSCVLKKSLLSIAEPMIELADSLGVDFLDFHNLIPSSLPGCGPDECLFDDDPIVVNALERLPSPGGLTICLPMLLRREIDDWRCKSFRKVLYVDGEGNVSGCYRVFPPDGLNGFALDKGVWKNGYFATYRRKLQKEEIPNACRYCVDLS